MSTFRGLLFNIEWRFIVPVIFSAAGLIAKLSHGWPVALGICGSGVLLGCAIYVMRKLSVSNREDELLEKMDSKDYRIMRARAGAHLVLIVGFRELYDAPPGADEYRNSDVEGMLNQIDAICRNALEGRVSREFFRLHVYSLASAYWTACHPLVIADGRWSNILPACRMCGQPAMSDPDATRILDSHANDRNNPDGWDSM